MHKPHSGRNSGGGTLDVLKSRKLLWIALGIVLAACVVALWVGAQWRPLPVQVERVLPSFGK